MFASRKNPLACALFYALTPLEDAIIQTITDLVGAVPDWSVMAWMCDGLLVRVPASASIDDLSPIVKEVETKYNITLKVNEMMRPVPDSSD
eukprot:4755156-Amphidinium_carterae.1